jgi:hypothetical protein
LKKQEKKMDNKNSRKNFNFVTMYILETLSKTLIMNT